MAVGSLFNIEIVPGGGGYIGEGGVVAGEIGGVLRGTVQHAVEDGDGLRTGDVAVGRVGGAVAVDPAELIGSVNVAGSPVAVGVGEDGARAGVVGAVAAGDHGRDLRTGDGIVRAEVAVSAAVDDAELRHGGHGGVVPSRGRNVLEGIIGGGIRLAGGIRQETIEDRRGLGTGDVVIILFLKTLVFGNRIITTSGTELFPVFFYILVLGDLDSNFLYYGQPFWMDGVTGI